MSDPGHGARIAILVAIITAGGAIIAAVAAPIVERSLDGNEAPPATVAARATATTVPPTRVRALSLHTVDTMILRANPWDNAPIIQEVPPGVEVSPGLERAVDNDGVVWMKLRVIGGKVGWVTDPPPVEPVFHDR